MTTPPEKLLPNEIMALTIWGEARNQSVEGQIAVGMVIMNRFFHSPKKYKSVTEVCLEPLQFSCWNDSDPNRAKILEQCENIVSGKRIDKYLRQAEWIAQGIMSDYFLDNTHGALNYMTNKLFYSNNRPKWAAVPKSDVIMIGDHTFFTA